MLLRPLISRREFCLGATVVLSGGSAPVCGQARGSDVQPEREFRDTSLRTISPDGNRFAFYSTKVAVETAAAVRSQVYKSLADHRADTLWILDRDADVVVFEKEISTRVSDASYFADGKKLFYLSMEGTTRGSF